MDQTADAGRPGDHFGQSDQGEGLTVGDAQEANRGARTQDGPAMSQNDADADQKIQGVLVQTRADLKGQEGLDGRALLAERLDQAGLDVTAEQLDALVARLSG